MGEVIDLFTVRREAARFAEVTHVRIANAGSHEELDQLFEELREIPAALTDLVIAELDAAMARRRRELRSVPSNGGTAA